MKVLQSDTKVFQSDTKAFQHDIVQKLTVLTSTMEQSQKDLRQGLKEDMTAF
jgi:hypothetical protein